MGIRFTVNTWRAPLQLINCWLPQHPSAPLISAKPAPHLLQRFAKAGWLHKPSPAFAPSTAVGRPANPTDTHRVIDRSSDFVRQSYGSRTTNRARLNGHLVLSGRIDQVCDELERLAALERRTYQ